MRLVTHLQGFVAITRNETVLIESNCEPEGRRREDGGRGGEGVVFLEERDAAVKNASDSGFLRPAGDPPPPLHLPR